MECRKPILQVNNLTISFTTAVGQLKAIRGINFSLQGGRTLAIVGESGSGKSVTVRAILGILSKNEKIEGGSIIYREEEDKVTDLLKLSKKQMVSRICGKKIAMVFQDPMTSLNPIMSIGKQVMEGILRHQGGTRRAAYQKAVKLLAEVGITEPERRMKNYPHQLSGGMRQRVVIAIALSCSPNILICDEPTTALDVTIQAKILELLLRIQKEKNIAIIYITHDMGVVAKVADDVAVMYAGKFIERGTVEEIFYQPVHPYTRGLLSSIPDINAVSGQLFSIPGTPPYLLGDIKGDPFASRNQYALNIDFEQEPPEFAVSSTHMVASWLMDARAPRIEVYPQLEHRIQEMLAVTV